MQPTAQQLAVNAWQYRLAMRGDSRGISACQRSQACRAIPGKVYDRHSYDREKREGAGCLGCAFGADVR